MTTRPEVLLVEDEAEVRAFVRIVLERGGYRVIEAGTLDDALHQFSASGGRVDLLAADVGLPDGTGPELHRRLSARQPQLPALFMSGDPDDAVLEAAADGCDAAFIQKPFTLAAFAASVQRLVAHPGDMCATHVAHAPSARSAASHMAGISPDPGT